MKISVRDKDGNKKHEITTRLFDEPIREDIIFKIIESEKKRQSYSNKLYAGMNRSASGNVSHKRHSWGSDRGRGMSRFPKKTMWRRGTQFSWIAAIIPSARGGRRAHPPKLKNQEKKINQKEYEKGLLSAISYSSNSEQLKRNYKSLSNHDLNKVVPIIVDSSIIEMKTKDLIKSLKNIMGEMFVVALKKEKTRKGIGKMRGRKKKKTRGVLIVVAKNEELRYKGIDSVRTNKLTVTDLAENGPRLTIFTEESIKELEKIKEKND